VSPPPPDPVIDAYVAEQVAQAPPLSAETAARLRVLLGLDPAEPERRAA